MVYQIFCPACSFSLFCQSEQKALHCPNCSRYYQLKFFVVDSIYLIETGSLKFYQIAGNRDAIKLTLPRVNLSITRGDLLLLVVSETTKKPITVFNLITQQHHRFKATRREAYQKGVEVGILTGVFAIIIPFVLGWSKATPKSVLLTGLPFSLGTGGLMAGVLLNRDKKDDKNSLTLVAQEQNILANIHQLQTRKRKQVQQINSEKEILLIFQNLRAAMEQTDPNLYEPKIEVINRGIKNYQEQIALSHQLLSNYDYLINVWQIEEQSLSLFNRLENQDLIFNKYSELEKLEEEKTILQLLNQDLTLIE